MNDRRELHDLIREMYKEGFHIDVIPRILNIPLDTVLEAIWGRG